MSQLFICTSSEKNGIFKVCKDRSMFHSPVILSLLLTRIRRSIPYSGANPTYLAQWFFIKVFGKTLDGKMYE